MAEVQLIDTEGLEKDYYRIYRDFFDQAEQNRRWSLRDDIPWDKVNPAMDPAIADIIESFCAVELYLPDYISKVLPQFRSLRGRAWFNANWGYEESKHSLALGDWLLRSGLRSEEQMADLERAVYEHEWNLPHDSRLGMVMYGMVQEMATWLNYRNLRYQVDEVGDPALSTLLRFIYVDERAHHDFYRRITMLYLERDRAASIEQLRRVIGGFGMPALSLLADSSQRVARIKAMHIFDEDIFYRDIVRPLLDKLGITWAEFRQRNPTRKSTPASPKM